MSIAGSGFVRRGLFFTSAGLFTASAGLRVRTAVEIRSLLPQRAIDPPHPIIPRISAVRLQAVRPMDWHDNHFRTQTSGETAASEYEKRKQYEPTKASVPENQLPSVAAS